MCRGDKTQTNCGKPQTSGLRGKLEVSHRPLYMISSREATENEEEAAKVVTSCLRRYAKARLKDSMKPGTLANQNALKLLTQSVPLLEPNIQKLGSSILQ